VSSQHDILTGLGITPPPFDATRQGEQVGLFLLCVKTLALGFFVTDSAFMAGNSKRMNDLVLCRI
jgi:hypothetical protein